MVLSWSNVRVLLVSPADFFPWKIMTFLNKITKFQYLFINRNSEMEVVTHIILAAGYFLLVFPDLFFILHLSSDLGQ